MNLSQNGTTEKNRLCYIDWNSVKFSLILKFTNLECLINTTSQNLWQGRKTMVISPKPMKMTEETIPLLKWRPRALPNINKLYSSSAYLYWFPRLSRLD